jgi:hypothetical protein
VTLKQGYKAYQISQEFIEDFKEKSKEKSTTEILRRSSGGSLAVQEADLKELAHMKESPVYPSGESSESGGESGNNRRLSKDCGDRSGGGEASMDQKPEQELRKMDTEL